MATIYFEIRLQNRTGNRNLVGRIGATCRSKIAKWFWSEIKEPHPRVHLSSSQVGDTGSSWPSCFHRPIREHIKIIFFWETRRHRLMIFGMYIQLGGPYQDYLNNGPGVKMARYLKRLIWGKALKSSCVKLESTGLWYFVHSFINLTSTKFVHI